MSQPTRYLALSVLLASSIAVSSAFAAPWNLPATIQDTNTVVTFEVDSTWHLVEGKTKNISGKISLADPSDYRTVHAEISLPVADFDTDSSRRDARMKEVLHMQQYPEVTFVSSAIDQLCDPSLVTPTSPCPITIRGNLTVSGTVKPVSIPATVSRVGEGFQIAGLLSINWAEYGIEDPSIFVAKLYPTVVVKFNVSIPSIDGSLQALNNTENGNAQH